MGQAMGYELRFYGLCGPLMSPLGGLVMLSIMGQPLAIVNSYETAIDLLEKRSAIYSSRPVRTMISL